MSALLALAPAAAPPRLPSIVYTPLDERDAMLNLDGDELATWTAVHQRVYQDTRSPVKAVAAALGAVNRLGRDLSLKTTVYRNTARIAGWGVVFGSARQRDSHGTYFSRRTRLHLLRGQQLPLRWDHMNGQPVGAVYRWQRHAYGYWFQAVVTAFYAAVFMDYVATGRLHFSSAVPLAALEQTADGEILSWPIIELSACPNPSESGVGSIIVDYPRAV